MTPVQTQHQLSHSEKLIILFKEVAKREGKKDPESYGNIEEVLKVVATAEAEGFRVTNVGRLKQELVQLFQEVARREGKKDQTSYGNIEEILKIVAKLDCDEFSIGGKSPVALIREWGVKIGENLPKKPMTKGLGPTFMIRKWANTMKPTPKPPVPKI